MNKFRLAFQLFVLAAFFTIASFTAQAQTRSWVSGVGNDVNPCSRTAPCRTFAGAINKTNTNGEINCLDPGGYGGLTITKSITIDCEDTQGSSLVSGAGVHGVTINLTTSLAEDPSSTVRLRGLTIIGTGNASRGIRVINTNTRPVKLFVDEVFIQNFVNEGIFFNGPGGDLVVRDSLISNITGTSPNSGAGIRTLSTLAGAAGIIHVSITRTTVKMSTQGIRFEGNTFGVVSNSMASNNTLNGFVVNPTSIGGAEMNIVDSTANNNRQYGVFAGGSGQAGVVRIFNLTAFHNTTLQLEVASGGSILSNGRNHIGTPTDAPGPFTDQ